MNEKCFNMSSGLTRLCENKEITLTHDFNRRNLGKNQTVFLTVSPVGMPLANGFNNIHTTS